MNYERAEMTCHERSNIYGRLFPLIGTGELTSLRKIARSSESFGEKAGGIVPNLWSRPKKFSHIPNRVPNYAARLGVPLDSSSHGSLLNGGNYAYGKVFARLEVFKSGLKTPGFKHGDAF